MSSFIKNIKMAKRIRLFIYFLLSIDHLMNGQTKVSIENLLQKEKISGAVWTIVQNDSITTFGAGFKNLHTKEKINSKDKVHIGSITKTVLALGFLMLETQGKIKIDDPIRKYLPNLPIQNPWEATNPITIRHLLDHTSGLSDLRLWHFFSSSSKPDTPLSEFYARNTKVLRVQAKPGELFSYSNMGYTLLGIIVEQITKQPYEKFLDENFLKLIGMYNSTFQFTSQIGEFKTEHLAMGHFDDGSIAPALPIYLRPAGQFTTTTTDMGILIKFILDKGKVGNKQVIDSVYFEKLGKPTYTIASKKGLHGGYALGISLRDRYGIVGYAHSGNIVGYRAMIYIFPNEKKGFFISNNMDSETADYEAFNKVLIEKLDMPKIIPKKEEGTITQGFEKWSGYYVPKITKIEPLKLFDIVSSFVKIELTEKGMKISPFQKKSIQINHVRNGLFQAPDRIYPSHLLYEDAHDKYLTTGINTLQKINGWSIFMLLMSLGGGLLGLVIVFVSGVYQSITYKAQIFRRPIFWTFLWVLFFILSIILIVSKNIVFIGDKNLGSFSLYFTSILFPILVSISLLAYLKNYKVAFKYIGLWATLLLLQLSLLFILFGLVPFSTWI
jgi:CubicO group peptidase (beta-lactamase class C family)